MKARFLVLAAMMLGLASCQTEPEGLNVNVGGEVDTFVTVTIPETETRAGYNDSALSVFNNGVLGDENDDVTMRYILEIYYGNVRTERQVQYSDRIETIKFPVRLVAGRDYNFVVWADVVVNGESDVDNHYNTKTENEWLTNVTLNGTWNAMDESRDAFTGYYNTLKEGTKYSGNLPINITLTRPFAKLRVVTTDVADLTKLGLKAETAMVVYTTPYRSAFNAATGTAYDAESNTKTHNTFEIASYADSKDGKQVLFTDYFFATDEVVKFDLAVYDEAGNVFGSEDFLSFNTDIPVKRNHLTTIQGNILTEGNNVNVTVDPVFENGSTWNPNEDEYDYATISSEAEFFAAVNGNSGQYILISDIDVDGVYASTNAATRTSTNKTVNINLNGKTITVNNDSSDALISLADGAALIFSGEGDIIGSGKLAEEGANVVVTGDVDVDANVTGVKTGVEALVYICANGGEFTFADNLTASEVVLVETTNPVVINGANHTLTSSATRAIRATVANANIVANDLNIVVTTERVGSNDIRGISIDDKTGVELTLNNCSVIFSHPSGNDWAYAVNVTGGSNHNVTINGGTYNGANVINVRGANQTVVVKDAILNCWYPNNDVYYGACIYVVQNQESSVYAEGNTFNGDNAVAFNIGYTPLEEKNNTDNTKRVAAKVGSTYYYNVAEAINAAEDKATVKVLQNHTCNVAATVPAGKTLTLDLNGKTITGTDSSTGSYAIITNKGNLTITGNGKMTLKAENNREWNAYSSVISNTVGGKLVVENGTIEHLGGTDMAYGIDNLTNGKGTYAETVINGGTIKSTYRAVRMFLNGTEAQNLLTVNGGTIEGANKSIWMQDPSKNANTGTLVVNEGAILNGDVYLFVTAGSTSWPVSVSIAASAVNGEVLTGNVPEGYAVELINGVWVVNAYTAVESIQDLDARLLNGEAVVMSDSITASAKETTANSGYGATGVMVKNGAVLDGNGKTLTINDAWTTWDCAVAATNGTIKNLTISGAMRGIFMPGATGDVVIDNVVFNNVIYTFNSDAGNKNYGVYISNSTLNGWTSHSDVHKEVIYTNCEFGQGNGYATCRPYGPTSFVGCNFEVGFQVEAIGTITFENCTIGGVALTADNLATLVTYNIANATVK